MRTIQIPLTHSTEQAQTLSDLFHLNEQTIAGLERSISADTEHLAGFLAFRSLLLTEVA